MIAAFLARSGLAGLANWIWIAIVSAMVAFAFVVVSIADNRDERMIETAKGSGAAEAVITGQTTTLDQLGDANDAEQNLRAGGERSAARRAECLRNSRRPAACDRYRPVAQ